MASGANILGAPVSETRAKTYRTRLMLSWISLLLDDVKVTASELQFVSVQTTLNGEPAKKRTKRAKKGDTFNLHHVEQYGLKIATVNATTNAPETVSCRFCVTFGREVGPTTIISTGKERAAVSTTKVWNKGHFRCDLYSKHLQSQHAKRWKEYEGLSASERASFFTTPVVPYVETLPAVFEGERPLEFVISSPIVESIIGDLLFHPDDVAQQSDRRQRALAIFKPDEGCYRVTERNPSRFRLAVRFLARGASFRMLAGLLDDVKEETEIGRFRGCTEEVAARCARIVCAISLERLSKLLSGVWALSFALDSATHQGRSYADVRCRFSTGGGLHNFHLLAIPLHDRHTAEYIFDVVKRFLDALTPSWPNQLLAVSTDGAATMVGNVKGVVTRFEGEARFPLTRVWCGLHQLDLKMQIIFQQALHGTYLDKLYALIGYLRRQFNLISEMQTTCPKVADTRWLSMYAVVDWLWKNGFRVREYLDDNNATSKPNLVWWIFLGAMREVAKAANEVFVSLQARSTRVEQQHAEFVRLHDDLRDTTGVIGPLSAEEIEELDPALHEVAGVFAISHANASDYTKSLGVWVCKQLPTLSVDQQSTAVRAVARLCVVSCNTLYPLIQVTEDLVPVTPKALVATSVPDFTALVAKHHDRLLHFVGEAGVYKIGEDFKELRDYYRTSKDFRLQLDAFDSPLASFEEEWAIGDAGSRFTLLVYFCGGLATVFPNTATVESDFSIIGCEKTDRRTGLTDLSLEGILHSKQWKRLKATTQLPLHTNSQ